jgi:hypothetical protein
VPLRTAPRRIANVHSGEPESPAKEPGYRPVLSAAFLVLNSPPEITCLIRETLMLPFPSPALFPAEHHFLNLGGALLELRHVFARQHALIRRL